MEIRLRRAPGVVLPYVALSSYGRFDGRMRTSTRPVLAPSATQFRGVISYGADNRKGLSYGFSAYYDYLKGVMQYSQAQVTYNTDCCGLSIQYGRFNLAARAESQFRVSFAVSNIGTFGTLKRQENIF